MHTVCKWHLPQRYAKREVQMEDMRNPTLKEGGINYFFPGIPILSVQSKISPIFIKTTILEQKKILRFACTKNFIRIHLLMIRTHL